MLKKENCRDLLVVVYVGNTVCIHKLHNFIKMCHYRIFLLRNIFGSSTTCSITPYSVSASATHSWYLFLKLLSKLPEVWFLFDIFISVDAKCFYEDVHYWIFFSPPNNNFIRLHLNVFRIFLDELSLFTLYCYIFRIVQVQYSQICSIFHCCDEMYLTFLTFISIFLYLRNNNAIRFVDYCIISCWFFGKSSVFKIS